MRHRAVHIAKPFFLLLAVLPVLAVCLLQYRQLHLQRRGKEKIERELLQTISVSKEALRWAKPEKEIWVNGHLFDVKSYSVKGNRYEFRGLFDEDETLVVNQLREQDRQQSNADLKMFSHLFKLLQSVFSEQKESLQYEGRGPVTKFADPEQAIASLFKLVNTPPPRC